MSKITKEFEEVELPCGEVVNLTITVVGVYEPTHGADADGNRGGGKWLIENWKSDFETEGNFELTDEISAEINEKVEELVYEEDWDFDGSNQRDDDELEPEEELDI